MDYINYLNTPFKGILYTSFQAMIIISLILLIKLLFRKKLSPQWHYILWIPLLIRLILPWLPETQFSVYNLFPNEKIDNTIENISKVSITNTVNNLSINTISHDIQSETENSFSLLLYHLPFLWLIGVFLLLINTIYQVKTYIVTIRKKRPVTEKRILDLLESCKEELDIYTHLPIIETSHIKAPALFGWIRPRLLLPEGILDGLSPNQLRHIFLHELSHLKRYDILTNWLMTIVQTIHWFNPLIWYAFYRIRIDRELACDAMTLSKIDSDDSYRYGQTIIHLLEKYAKSTYLPVMASIMEDTKQIKRRIDMISSFKKVSYKFSIGIVTLFMILNVFVLTNAQKTESEQKKDQSGFSNPIGEMSKTIAFIKGFVDLLAKENYTAAVEKFDPKMKEMIPEAKLEDIWQDVIKQFGPFQKRTITYDIQYDYPKPPSEASVKCLFEKDSLRIKIALNEKQEISGLWILPLLKKENSGVNPKTDPAIKAAGSWLELIDSNQFARSWQSASQIFKQALTQEKWVNTMQTQKPILGKPLSRKLKNAEYKTALPGAPDGEYVIIQYETEFEKKQNGIETVVPAKDTDNIWRVSGYFIK